MIVVKPKNRQQLVAIIQQQQDEIMALRSRVEALEAEDVGELRRRVAELEDWKMRAEDRIRDLEAKAAMSQSLVMFVGASIVALLGEKLIDVLKSLPLEQIEEMIAPFSKENREEVEKRLGKEKLEELENHFGNFVTTVIDTVQRVDKVTLQVWQRQKADLERRAATLPPMKRALFEAMKQYSSPAKITELLLKTVLTVPELAEKLTEDGVEKLRLVATVFDSFSNLWPLTVTNSLAPMLKHVGFDEAAEAAGEILDQLESCSRVPRHLVYKVKPDLVEAGVIQKSTKPSTIIEYLEQGYKLEQLSMSPDQAAFLGDIPASSTQLKRAKGVYRGLYDLYDRVQEFPLDIGLENLETFGQAIERMAKEKIDEIRELVEVG